jgi:hypothetical protein
MARIRYKRSSPYADTNQTSWYLDYYKDRPILKFEDDQLIVLSKKYEHKPDLLSQDLYGTPRFWWVFQRRNLELIKDPIWDFKVGLEIQVPSRERMASFGD